MKTTTTKTLYKFLKNYGLELRNILPIIGYFAIRSKNTREEMKELGFSGQAITWWDKHLNYYVMEFIHAEDWEGT